MLLNASNAAGCYDPRRILKSQFVAANPCPRTLRTPSIVCRASSRSSSPAHAMLSCEQAGLVEASMEQAAVEGPCSHAASDHAALPAAGTPEHSSTSQAGPDYKPLLILPLEPQLSQIDVASPDAPRALQAALVSALAAADAYLASHPEVEGALCRRLRGDLAFLERAAGLEPSAVHAGQAAARQQAARARKLRRREEAAAAAAAAAVEVAVVDQGAGVGEAVEEASKGGAQELGWGDVPVEPHSSTPRVTPLLQERTPQEEGALQQQPPQVQQQQQGQGQGQGPQHGQFPQQQPFQQQQQQQQPHHDSRPPQSHHAPSSRTGATTPSVCAADGAGARPAAGPTLSLARTQGILNNLRGFQGELAAALLCTDVVAVQRRFYAVPCAATPAPGSATAHQTSARRRAQEALKAAQREKAARKGAAVSDAAAAAVARAPQQGAETGDCVAEGASGRGVGVGSVGAGGVDADMEAAAAAMFCEVDVVACGGSLWLEAKNQNRFGLDSEHWLGGGSFKGLRRQALEMLAVAAAPCNAIRWAPPAVAVFFVDGAAADQGVVAALRDMGVHVALGLGELAALPRGPPEPDTTNLDTTTMCALVSQMSHAPATDPHVAAWAARTCHWRDALAAEAAEPMMSGPLARVLAPGRRLVAADTAVAQFEVLLAQFGGPQERVRWESLRARLEVLPVSQQPDALVSARVAGLGALREVGPHQAAVLGLGDALRAVTTTANGAAVRSAARQGVALEALVHRAVWLTGI